MILNIVATAGLALFALILLASANAEEVDLSTRDRWIVNVVVAVVTIIISWAIWA